MIQNKTLKLKKKKNDIKSYISWSKEDFMSSIAGPRLFKTGFAKLYSIKATQSFFSRGDINFNFI